MGVSKPKKFLPILIGALIVLIFIAGFGIAYSIRLPFHNNGGETGNSLGGRLTGVNHPTINGAMSIYFIDPSGRRVPVGNSVMDIVFTSNGRQVKYIAGDVTLRVSGQSGDTFTYKIEIYFSVEKVSAGSSGGTPVPGKGIQPQSIVPLQLVPGGSSTGNTDDYKLVLTGKSSFSGTTVTISKSFKVEIAQLIQGAQAGDKYHITVYAEAYVEDTSNGSHDHAVSDAVSFNVQVSNSGAQTSTASIEIDGIKISPSTSA